jgi:SAM-dependent methyltransferase
MRTCGSCGATGLEEVLSLGEQPLANALLADAQLTLPEPRYPLGLAFCPRCCLAQITQTVDPGLLFSRYPYFSSVSEAFVAHAQRLVDRMVASGGLGPASLAIELASNDGYLLQHYVQRGIPVLGIDPAANMADVAAERGVPTLTRFFDRSLAEELRADGTVADVVHANNVIAHVPDIHGFVAGIARILKPSGIAVIETPYVRDLVDGLEFDTIYHEHVFYYSLTALDRILNQHDLVISDVERLPIHGGSLRIHATPAGQRDRSASVDAMLNEEAELGMCALGYFRHFAERVDDLRARILTLLDAQKASGRVIAAYGAAAKGTVLLNSMGTGPEIIEFVADRSPWKHGMYMPGVHIPVVPAERLAETVPDVCLLLAWNFQDEILQQQADYRLRGGQFIVPIPGPRLI